MASLNLSQEELKALEQTRQRLSQLSNSIWSLKADVQQSNQLPSLYVRSHISPTRREASDGASTDRSAP